MRKLILLLTMTVSIYASTGWTTMHLKNWKEADKGLTVCYYRQTPTSPEVSIIIARMFCPFTIQYNFYLRKWK